MTVVVDVGCSDREGRWPSLEPLAEMYHPTLIYGFDPSPSLNARRRKVNGVPVKLKRAAAWTFDGRIEFEDQQIGGRHGPIGVAGNRGMVGSYSAGRIGMIGEGSDMVPCFDFSAWLAKHGPAVVKLDVEGAEYVLLDRLIADGTHTLITELLIEWHFTEDKMILRAFKRAKIKVKPWLY